MLIFQTVPRSASEIALNRSASQQTKCKHKHQRNTRDKLNPDLEQPFYALNSIICCTIYISTISSDKVCPVWRHNLESTNAHSLASVRDDDDKDLCEFQWLASGHWPGQHAIVCKNNKGLVPCCLVD